jgi:hypothetical protein
MKDHSPKMVCAVLAVMQHNEETKKGQLAFIGQAASSTKWNIMPLIEAMQALNTTNGPDFSWVEKDLRDPPSDLLSMLKHETQVEQNGSIGLSFHGHRATTGGQAPVFDE